MRTLEGQSFDEFLKAEDVGKKNIPAFRRVIAWRISEEMTTRGISTDELARRIRTRPDEIVRFLESPESAPLLITTLREAMAAVGNPLITFWDSMQ
jgi:ribosome-binding protein aMBF1 (putative translation factor)